MLDWIGFALKHCCKYLTPEILYHSCHIKYGIFGEFNNKNLHSILKTLVYIPQEIQYLVLTSDTVSSDPWLQYKLQHSDVQKVQPSQA